MAVVGRDPRASGEFLEAAVVAGLASAGVDVLRVGVLPTPAVALPHRATLGADLGVMISASATTRCPTTASSSSPAAASSSPTSSRTRIEAAHARAVARGPTGAAVGPRPRRTPTARRALRRPPARARCRTALDGLHVVVDCAHGAASARRARGARARRRRGHRDRRRAGRLNINDGCGSTHLEPLQRGRRRARRRPRHRARRRRRPLPRRRRRRRRSSTATRSWPSSRWRCASAGRCVGRHRGRHRDDATSASSMAMDARGHHGRRDRGRRPLRARGDAGRRLRPRRRAVRPRHPARPRHHRRRPAHRAARCSAGWPPPARTLAELAARHDRLPAGAGQRRRRRQGTASTTAPRCRPRSPRPRPSSATTGRVLLRPSGTEPLVRVMVEAPTEAQARDIADRLADVVRTELALD